MCIAKVSNRQINIQYTGWAKKRYSKLMAMIVSNLNRFLNFFHWKIFGKFAEKSLLKVPLMSENKRLTINYKKK